MNVICARLCSGRRGGHFQTERREKIGVQPLNPSLQLAHFLDATEHLFVADGRFRGAGFAASAGVLAHIGAGLIGLFHVNRDRENRQMRGAFVQIEAGGGGHSGEAFLEGREHLIGPCVGPFVVNLARCVEKGGARGDEHDFARQGRGVGAAGGFPIFAAAFEGGGEVGGGAHLHQPARLIGPVPVHVRPSRINVGDLPETLAMTGSVADVEAAHQPLQADGGFDFAGHRGAAPGNFAQAKR